MLDFGFYNMDCMDGMKNFPDQYFDLAIVDPPYGDALGNGGGGTDSVEGSTNTRRIPRGGGTENRSTSYKRHLVCGLRKGQSPPSWWNLGGEVRKKIISWDVAPKQEYFDELFRVSRNQIIWGATTSIYLRHGVF